jgi:hypothetical protein
VELGSLAGWYKHFGSPFVDNRTGKWHLMNFPCQYVYIVVYRTPVLWNMQQTSKWIVENNSNELRKISVAVGNLNHTILLHGNKNFNLGIWTITLVCIEINEWHGATKMKTTLTKIIDIYINSLFSRSMINLCGTVMRDLTMC